MSEEAVREARALGDDWTLRFSLVTLGGALRYGQRDLQRADVTLVEALALSRAAGDQDEVARLLVNHVGVLAQERRDFTEALRCAEEALTLVQMLDDPATELNARRLIAENMCYLGDVLGAAAILENCLESMPERLNVIEKMLPMLSLARVMNTAGDYSRANTLLIQALRLRRTRPMRFGQHQIFDAMAVVAAAQGKVTHAARLRGMADNMIALNNQYREAHHAWEYAPYIARARTALGDAAYEAAVAEGRAMTVEQAVAYALGEEGDR